MRKSILFLSWRDIKAPKKGGAEVFTHEMLRLVDTKNIRLYIFRHSLKGDKKKEVIDGVKYIRKGNIASVILWAMLTTSKIKRIRLRVDQCNVHRFLHHFGFQSLREFSLFIKWHESFG